jgi:hypothetical protein
MPELSSSELRVMSDLIEALLILCAIGFGTMLTIGLIAEKYRRRCR